jgi:Antistasin family.
MGLHYRTSGPTDCEALRKDLGCLDLTCRLGCDYGFVLESSTRCPLCECRNPCDDVICPKGQTCQMVEVNCEDEYCPPVPACELHKVYSFNDTVWIV